MTSKGHQMLSKALKSKKKNSPLKNLMEQRINNTGLRTPVGTKVTGPGTYKPDYGYAVKEGLKGAARDVVGLTTRVAAGMTGGNARGKFPSGKVSEGLSKLATKTRAWSESKGIADKKRKKHKIAKKHSNNPGLPQQNVEEGMAYKRKGMKCKMKHKHGKAC